MLCHRYEASQLPDIVVADVNARAFDDKRTKYVAAPTVSSGYQSLDEQWLQTFLADFAQLRVNMQRYGNPLVKQWFAKCNTLVVDWLNFGDKASMQ